jgi:predicted MFS family arabinose efflux permease
VLTLVAVAAVALVLFMVIETRREAPLIDLALLRARPFVNVNVCAFGYGFALYIGVFLAPQIAAGDLGLSVTEIGLLLVPTSIVGMLGGWLGGRAFQRLGSRTLVILGALVAVAGYISLASAHGSAAALALGSAVIGLGLGLVPTGYLPVALRSAAVDKSSIAASVVLVARNVGTAMGLTAAAAVVTGAGYTRALVFGAVAAAVVALLGGWLPATEGPRAGRRRWS